MSEIILHGITKVVGPEMNVSASYTKRQLVITTEEQYPQVIEIEFPQGKCNNELDQLVPGVTRVSASVNIGGREWFNPQGETKYFNSIKGWKLSIVTTTQQNAAPTAATPAPAAATPQTPVAAAATAAFQASANFNEEEHDDLPF